jgi:hypothetical protein
VTDDRAGRVAVVAVSESGAVAGLAARGLAAGGAAAVVVAGDNARAVGLVVAEFGDEIAQMNGAARVVGFVGDPARDADALDELVDELFPGASLTKGG